MSSVLSTLSQLSGGLCACPCLAEPHTARQIHSIAASCPGEGPPGAGWPRAGQKRGSCFCW